MNRRYRFSFSCTLFAVLLCSSSMIAQCTGSPSDGTKTDPTAFTTIKEIPIHGNAIAVANDAHTNGVQNQSTIRIHFDAAQMACPRPLRTGGDKRPAVTIRLEAYSVRGTSRTPIAPIHPYVDQYIPPKSDPGDSGTIVYHDKDFNPSQFASVPDADITLLGTEAATADSIDLRIININTQEVLHFILIPQSFGFHFKVSDTLMFVKRLGIGTKEKQAGISDFNFGPAPGVAYGGTYFARKNAFMRFLQPGAGINVMFTKWDNPSFDVSTGQFVPGTKGSDIQTAMGGQLTLFGNVIQLGYGANLQVDQKRAYFGVGVSFVNLTTKLAGLISK
jgi:hypothetical protein